MSCSNIFSGNLPELTHEVIKYFQNDYSTLHSCILVNRLWCRLAIPLLWENPFSICTGNYNFIEIYLHNLNDDFKTKLNKYKIINKSSHSNILFNYPRFLKYLDIYKFIFSVEKWYKLATKISILENVLYLETDYKRLADLCVSLFKIFIENEVNLHTLEIEISSNYYQPCLDSTLDELILKNTNFIHNIRNLNLHISNYNENTVIKNRISQMINLQQNLKKLLIGGNSFSLYQSLLLSRGYNCSNTLNTIIFFRVDFKGINNLKTVFEQLYVLESIHILYCYSLKTSFTQQIINLTKPFKLKSLIINEMPQIESLELLLQKSGEYLENFGNGFNHGLSSNQQLLQLITKYCKNIKFFDFCNLEGWITYQIFNLIENIKQNLNYLTFNICFGSTRTECSSVILQNLGQILPSKLEYLCLNLSYIKASDFEIFLIESQDTFIKKLLICNSEGQYILPSIKEYIMKKKRVKYLAINSVFSGSTLVSFDYNVKELFSFKDEVKEFRLYNIEIQSYSDLVFSSYNYIKEID